jgi:hypothetical protein
MAKGQEAMKEQADRHRRDITFEVGDKVWLSTKNLKTERPSKKLDHKQIGPFKIVAAKPPSYTLDLPTSMNLDCRTFHASLLSRDPNDPLPTQTFDEPPPVIIDNEEQWEVEEIIDVKKTRGGGLRARAKWVGYDEDPQWYPIDDFKDSIELLEDFYARNQGKPKPKWFTAST